MTDEKAPVLWDGDRQMLTFSTLEGAYRLAQVYRRILNLPRHLNSDDKALGALIKGRTVGLPDQIALESSVIVNGKVTFEVDVYLAQVMGSGLVTSFNTGFKGHGEERYAFCQMGRRGVAGVTSRTFSIADARRAGLANKNTWKTYPDDMLMKRATIRCLRALFGDIVMGLVPDYEPQDDPEPVMVTPLGEMIENRRAEAFEVGRSQPPEGGSLQENIVDSGRSEAVALDRAPEYTPMSLGPGADPYRYEREREERRRREQYPEMYDDLADDAVDQVMAEPVIDDAPPVEDEPSEPSWWLNAKHWQYRKATEFYLLTMIGWGASFYEHDIEIADQVVPIGSPEQNWYHDLAMKNPEAIGTLRQLSENDLAPIRRKFVFNLKIAEKHWKTLKGSGK